MPTNDKSDGQTADPSQELDQLRAKMDKAKNPSDDDIYRFRNLLVATPALWYRATQTMPSIRSQLIEKISYGTTRGGMLAEVEVLKKQLDYDTAPQIERLLIDHLLTVRLRVIDAENRYNQTVVNQSISLKVGEYWEGVLTAAHTRYMKAILTLAKVRKLARNTPALQINVAMDGGKQVNVQDGATGQQATDTETGTSASSYRRDRSVGC